MTDNQQNAVHNGVQDEPIMDMHEASDDDKVTGILNQERLDSAGTDPERIAEQLRDRFGEAGVDVDDDFIREQAQKLSEPEGRDKGYNTQDSEPDD